MDKERQAIKNIIVALIIGFAIFMSVNKEDMYEEVLGNIRS